MSSWRAANLERFSHYVTKTSFFRLYKTIPAFELNFSIKTVLTFLTLNSLVTQNKLQNDFQITLDLNNNSEINYMHAWTRLKISVRLILVLVITLNVSKLTPTDWILSGFIHTKAKSSAPVTLTKLQLIKGDFYFLRSVLYRSVYCNSTTNTEKTGVSIKLWIRNI